MISIRNIRTGKIHKFDITKFPDGTSQAWRVSPEPKESDNFEVTWMFENEAEFVHVLQILMLLHQLANDVVLFTPFLPYARQDKDISNSSTFAVWPVISALGAFVSEFKAYDVHSNHFGSISNVDPFDHFFGVLDTFDPINQVIVFPDKGAKDRYSHGFEGGYPIVYGEKIRNQETGEILGLKINGDVSLIQNSRCVIFDDICDGGATFVKMAEALKEFQPSSIDLCVSHGIFSKGKKVLHDAGIKNIYTTNSLLKNKDDFSIVQLEA